MKAQHEGALTPPGQDEALARYSVSREVPRSVLKSEKLCLVGKDSDAGKDWGQEEKGTTEDEMAGWHHRLDGCESE